MNKIDVIVHSSIRIIYNDLIIYIDPFNLNKNYSKDADYIFITHSHYDHFSINDILDIKKNNTKIIIPYDLEDKVKNIFNNYLLVKPNNNYSIDNIKFSTTYSYNINKNFHRKEYNWVGYLLYLDDIIYIAGDTDNINEIQNIKCDIACVPIGGIYTMNVLEAVELIKCIKPRKTIPIHYGTIVGSYNYGYEFKKLLENITNVELWR